MLEQQKRKDELNRVNQKFGQRQDQNSSPSKVERQQSYDVEEMLKMKTSDFMDEAERQILVNNVQKQESNLLSDLDSKKDADDDGTGQRMLDDAEFEDELNGHNAMV